MYLLKRQICPEEDYQVSFEGLGNEVFAYDFANEVSQCAVLSIDVVSNRRRRCFTNLTTITYQNKGLDSVENVKVEVIFPKLVVPQSSTLPWISVQDSLYTFDIGTLRAGEQGVFIITDSVVCIADIRGLTQCTQASIFPRNTCFEPSEAWNRADLEVSGICTTASDVQFTIKNIGEGNMNSPQPYIVYADNEIIFEDNIQLNAGDSLSFEMGSQNQSLRLEVKQVGFHPRNTFVSVSIEGCGTTSENISKGFINQYPQNDENLGTEIDCLPIIDSYDPNDKLVSPEGVTENNFVKPGTTLEYVIRFQNTGTAEAVNIEVIDTLSSDLDLNTFQMMSASHRYALDILPPSITPILRWKFNNINLPDSATNEPESHGFVKFKISPKTGLEEGTIIENFADIYFDFNEPIRTNTTLSNFTDYTLPENIRTIKLITSLEEDILSQAIKLFPNPTTAMIKLNHHQISQENWSLKILNILGIAQQVHFQRTNENTLEINLRHLNPGIYYIRFQTPTGTGVKKFLIE